MLVFQNKYETHQLNYDLTYYISICPGKVVALGSKTHHNVLQSTEVTISLPMSIIESLLKYSSKQYKVHITNHLTHATTLHDKKHRTQNSI